ncbi:hypothetical protein I3J27_21355 [Bradyrhizobium xenonodulans]|uniref:Uncharacterized protein n=1 Tax=Bradyrhizobium xenonodulans TaxID=2736875 RepID=A0ABY7MBH3_9BRAD|nr:hypothetical protein [Bradyrhizobium xenonodulans]WBL75583.1 hypothetical protein I3J27_21355 [Bradyrhizobium xenonodulans]
MDALVFQHTPWAVTVFLALLTLIFLLYFARQCGVDWVIVPLEQLYNRMLGGVPGKDGHKE